MSVHLEYERLHSNDDLYTIPMHCQGFQWHLKKAALHRKGLKDSFIPPI